MFVLCAISDICGQCVCVRGLGLVLLKQTICENTLICQNIKGISVYQLMTNVNVPRVKLNSFFCSLIMVQVAEYCKETFLWTNLKETSTCFHFLICHYMSAEQNVVSLLCFKCFF